MVTLLSVAAGIVVFVLISQLELTQLKTQKAILLLALTMTGGENELKEYSVVLSNVTKIFDDSFTAVDNVSLYDRTGRVLLSSGSLRLWKDYDTKNDRRI